MSEPAATGANNPDQLNLKVKSQVLSALLQDGEEVFFKIKSTTQLKKLMDAYCQRQNVLQPSPSSVPATSASFSTESAFTRDRLPRTSTWRTETRLMLSSSRSEEPVLAIRTHRNDHSYPFIHFMHSPYHTVFYPYSHSEAN